MFWNTLKWGATTLLLGVFCLALWRASPSDSGAQETSQSGSDRSARQADNPPPKKFNF